MLHSPHVEILTGCCRPPDGVDLQVRHLGAATEGAVAAGALSRDGGAEDVALHDVVQLLGRTGQHAVLATEPAEEVGSETCGSFRRVVLDGCALKSAGREAAG